jgi:hypothetical protein
MSTYDSFTEWEESKDRLNDLDNHFDNLADIADNKNKDYKLKTNNHENTLEKIRKS